jgi:glycerate 2-kinase
VRARPKPGIPETVKQTAQRIFQNTLAAIDIPATLARKLPRNGSCLEVSGTAIDLRKFREIVAIAFGKASFAMAEGLRKLLEPDFPVNGILVGPAPPARQLPGWKSFTGGHPIPNEQSFAAGRAILDLLARCGEETLIFFLLSGGGSALVEQGLDPAMTHEDFQKLNYALVTCGAPIEEINIVRKHLSATKGGRLAAAAPRSVKITLGVSDVPEGQETALASGPTIPDPTTVRDVERVARECNLLEKLPASLQKIFERGEFRETPKQGDPAFSRAHFMLLLGMHDLLHCAHHAAEAEGYVSLCDTAADSWPIEKAADHLLAQLEILKKNSGGKPVAILADGEVSSPVTGNGIGGRNSAFVLACVPKIAGRQIAVLSAGTDGIDGNSPAAGARGDGETMSRARAANLDPGDFFRRSDAYNFFARLDDAILTGPTGNNLRDLRILLAH